MASDLQSVIERAWEERDAIDATTKGEVRQAVDVRVTDVGEWLESILGDTE